MPKEVLYVGLDESNHHNGLQSEICVAAFSSIKEDRECRIFNSCKDYTWKNEMLNNKARDYRFVLLNCNDICPKRHNNLPVVAPSLIIPFLNFYKPERLEIYIDGVVSKEDKKIIIESILQGIDIYIQGFIKYFKQERNSKEKRVFGKENSKNTCSHQY